MNFIIAAVTDVGIEKDTNQDSFLARTVSTVMGKVVLAVLCDGMGGLDKGELASASVVNAFRKWGDTRLPGLCAQGLREADVRADWLRLVGEFNEKIKLYGKQRGINLGTTVTALLLTEERYFIMNVGDTRAYELTQGVRQLTRDQTLVAREVEQGILSEEAARVDPRRSVLLQCIGASDEVYPEFFFGQTQVDGVYMLCSDGFRHELTEGELYQHLAPQVMLSAEGMEENMRMLIELNKSRQERDNITVVTIRTF